ncbi:uncharacterized protein METZ01_LOCUS13099, partial [marine metagenome]
VKIDRIVDNFVEKLFDAIVGNS